MKELTTIAIISVLLFSQGCKKCYRCQNNCCKRSSTNEFICTSQFSTYEEYSTFMDSLGADVSCAGADARSTFNKTACQASEIENYEAMQGVTCVPMK